MAATESSTFKSLAYYQIHYYVVTLSAEYNRYRVLSPFMNIFSFVYSNRAIFFPKTYSGPSSVPEE